MQLPDYNFGGPLPTAQIGAGEQAAHAAAGLGSTVEQGLSMLSQEMVKTQTQDAHLALSAGIDKLSNDLNTKKAFSQDELKQALGDEGYASLPEAARNQPPQPVLDANGQPVLGPDGQPTTRAGDVPAWQVVHAVYAKKAQDLLDQSAQHITVSEGWQNSFRRAALQDLIAKGSALNDKALQQFAQYQQDKRRAQILDALNHRDFATASTMNDGSLEVFGKDGQQQMGLLIAARKQDQPIVDALIAFRHDATDPDVGEKLKDASAALADDAKTGLLTPEHRATQARAIQAAQRSLEEHGQKREAARIALGILRETHDPENPDKVDAVQAGRKLEARFQPGGDLEGKPELYPEAQSLLKKTADDHNAAVKEAFDGVAGGAIKEYLSMDGAGAYHASSTNLSPQSVAALHAAGKQGEELLNQFRTWDRANEMDARTKRNTPTDLEEGRAFRIERSMAVNPGAWRALSGADQMAILAGRKPVPGEADAPAVAVSARDVPALSKKIAEIAASVKPAYVTSPEKVAFEEAQDAFPGVLKKLKPDANISNADVRKAVKGLSDKLAAFIDNGRNATGQEPDQAAIRGEARRLMQTVEVKQSFMGIPYHSKTTRLQAEQSGQDFEAPDQGGGAAAPGGPGSPAPAGPGATAPTPGAAAAPGKRTDAAPSGKVWVYGPGGKVVAATEKGLDAWLKTHPAWSR